MNTAANIGVAESASPRVAADAGRSTAIEIVVVFTDVPSTRAALRTACQCAQGLSARIRLLALHPVPWTLPLDKPPVSAGFSQRQLLRLLAGCPRYTDGPPPKLVAENRLCRETWHALIRLLPPRSIVVIGKRSKWWPKPEDSVARKLRAAGHHVVRSAFRREEAAHA